MPRPPIFFHHRGDGATDPTGDWYYHANFRGDVHKYDIRMDVASGAVASADVPNRTAKLVVTGDGSLIFQGGAILDPDLNVLGQLSDVIYAASATF